MIVFIAESFDLFFLFILALIKHTHDVYLLLFSALCSYILILIIGSLLFPINSFPTRRLAAVSVDSSSTIPACTPPHLTSVNKNLPGQALFEDSADFKHLPDFISTRLNFLKPPFLIQPQYQIYQC